MLSKHTVFNNLILDPAHWSAVRNIASYFLFVVMTMMTGISRGENSWDYGSSHYEWERGVERANKALSGDRSKRADVPKSQRYAQCDAGRRKCTECLIQPGVDGVACHFACEEEFNRCMAADEGSQGPASSMNGNSFEPVSRDQIALTLSAAEQGDTRAQLLSAILYYLGAGVNRDQDKGLSWLSKAVIGGNEDAIRLYNKVGFLQMGSNLTSYEYMLYQQLEPAQRRVFLDRKKKENAKRVDAIIREFVRLEGH